MPQFFPFRAWTYNFADVKAQDVLCPPYDVISSSQRAELCQRSLFNAVNIELPNPDLGQTRYVDAAALLEEWKSKDIVRQLPEDHYFKYEMVDQDGVRTIGLIGALKLEKLDQTSGVIPHERTTSKDKTDRLNLLSATQFNLSCVWALSLASNVHNQINSLNGEILFENAEVDGVKHTVSIIEPNDALQLTESINSNLVLIADGHHRYETALTYHSSLGNLEAGRIMTFICGLDETLKVLPIHRIISRVNENLSRDSTGSDQSSTTSWVDDYFDRRRLTYEEAESVRNTFSDSYSTHDSPVSTFIMICGEECYELIPNQATIENAEFPTDASALDYALANHPELAVRYTHNNEELLDACNNPSNVVFHLRPVAADVIRQSAHRRLRMPPKSTLFMPKLATGVCFRQI